MWFELLFGLSAGVIIAYAILQCYFTIRFTYLTAHSPSKKESPSPSLSVVIPFRNEEKTLEAAVKSVLKAVTPIEKTEILLIDDHSDDRSVRIAESLTRTYENIQFLDAKKAGKKSAIAEGIEQASSDWIFTADADCVYSEGSISNLLFLVVEKDLNVGCLPVIVEQSGSLLNAYQHYESCGLMLITAVSLRDRLFYSASGAALLYRKSMFQKLQPFDDNYHIPSGDDQFFLYAYQKTYAEPILFYKNRNTRVSTRPHLSWQQLIDQRLRWAGKNAHLNDYKLRVILALTIVADLSVFILVLLFLVKAEFLIGGLVVLLFKTICEGMLLTGSSRYWKNKSNFRFLPLVILIHPFVRLALFISFIAKRKISWKGRTVVVR